jgi:hypothetical protein
MEALFIKKELKKPSMVTITSVNFYSDFVAKSRPVFLSGMSRTWAAFDSWNYGKGGNEYLKTLLGDQIVTVYIDQDPSIS